MQGAVSDVVHTTVAAIVVLNAYLPLLLTLYFDAV